MHTRNGTQMRIHRGIRTALSKGGTRPMANHEHERLAHAFAKAFVQPGVSDDTVEQCIYQIALVLANDDPNFDLRRWRRLITKRHASLKQFSGATQMRKVRLATRTGRKETGSCHAKKTTRNGKVHRA